jgi:hypothetical protein
VTKQDSFPKRLKFLIEFASSPKDNNLSLANLGMLDVLPTPKPDLHHMQAWTVVARSAFDPLSIDRDPFLGRAFEALKLDPADPIHWRMLASQLAYVAFPEPNPGGKPKEWDAKQYCELLEAVDHLKSKRSGRSDREACTILAKSSENRLFCKAGSEGLRKALRKARSRKTNEAIKYLLEVAKPRIVRKIQEAGGEWLPSTQDLYEELYEKEIVSWIGSRWRRGDKTPS